MNRNRPNFRPAFTLTESLIALALLTVVLSVGGELFRSIVHLSAENARAMNQSARTDSVLSRLRQDVWGCDDIVIASPQTVRLRIPGEDWITWEIGADGSAVRRVGDSPAWRCESVAMGWILQREGDCLRIDDLSGPQAGQVRLVSQLLLARRNGS